MLTVDRVSLAYRGVHALRDVSLEVAEGSVTALIGPNGAGKTTLFNCISRIASPSAGTICFRGNDLGTIAGHRLVRLGVARTFQHAALFASLSVRDNVRVGVDATGQPGTSADDALDLLGLGGDAGRTVDSLPLGTRKRVEIARALATRPQMLLLDEPAGGLTHGEVDEMRDLLLQVRAAVGLTILLVEHHVNMVMSMSDHIVVLASGEVIAAGPPQAIQSDSRVIAAYLGG